MLLEEEHVGQVDGEDGLGELEREDWPNIAWVPLGDVRVDRSYQRDEIPRHIRAIAEDLDLERFGTPEVAALDDGTFNLLDGQQRVAAARYYNDMGLGPAVREVRCVIHEDKSPEEQARLYVLMNTKRVRVSAFDQWKPRILFGDEVAQQVQAVLDRYGVEVGKGEDKVGAVAAIEDIFTTYKRKLKASDGGYPKMRRDGSDALDRTFDAITTSWSIHEGRFKSDVIAGVGLFFHRFVDAELDYDTLAKTMTKLSPEALRSEATSEIKKSYGLESRRSAMAKTLALSYNRQAKLDGTRALPVDERFPGN